MSLIYKLVKRTNISLDKGTGHKQVIHRKKKKTFHPIYQRNANEAKIVFFTYQNGK